MVKRGRPPKEKNLKDLTPFAETEDQLNELQDLVGRLLMLLGERQPENPQWWLRLAATKIAIGEWGE